MQTEALNFTQESDELHVDNSQDSGHHKRSVNSNAHTTDPHADPYGYHGHGYTFQVYVPVPVIYT